MPARRDKTTGLPLPSPVVPSDTICFKMTIPNALEYRTALKGILSDLGRAWTWSQTIGQDNEDAHTAAEIWRAAIATAEYIENCEADMSCADVANCIETDAETQAAIDAAVIGSSAVNSYFNTTNNIGVPMLAAAAAANLTGDAACDLDALFGSVTAIINQLNVNNVDFLEQLEIESNTIERVADLFAAIPIAETLPVDDALNFVDTLLGDIKENYDATVTTALIDEYRCGIFCLARDNPDCEVSFDTLIGYFENRLSVSFEPANIFLDFVSFFTDGTWVGTQIVDVMMLGQLAIWRAASNFLGLSLRTLQVVGALGANDEDPDWAILCTDCPAEWCFKIDFKLTDGSEYGVSPNIIVTGLPEFLGFAWVEGVGLVTSGATDADRTFGRIPFPEPITLSGSTMKWSFVDPASSGNIWMDQNFGSPSAITPPTFFLQRGEQLNIDNYVFGGDKPGADVSPFIIIEELTLSGPMPIPEQFGASNC